MRMSPWWGSPCWSGPFPVLTPSSETTEKLMLACCAQLWAASRTWCCQVLAEPKRLLNVESRLLVAA